MISRVVHLLCVGDVGVIAINSSSGELYVNDVVDREDPSLIRTDGVLQIIVKVAYVYNPEHSHSGRW